MYTVVDLMYGVEIAVESNKRNGFFQVGLLSQKIRQG
jgi:hypothetical protein